MDNILSSLNNTIAANKTKNESVENEIKRLKTLDLSYFIGKSHFEEDSTQNYLVFQPINSYFEVIANKLYISSWKSKGLSDETIKSPVTSDNSLTPLIEYVCDKIIIKFSGSCLKQSKMQYTYRTIVKTYIVYELGASDSNNNDQKTNLLFLQWRDQSQKLWVELVKNWQKIIHKHENENKYLIFDSTDENKELLKILRCLEWNWKQNGGNK